MDPDVNENVRTTFTYRRLFYIRITSFIWGKRASKWKRDRVEKERKWEWEKIGSSKWEWWCLKRTNATARNLQGRIEMNIFNKNINMYKQCRGKAENIRFWCGIRHTNPKSNGRWQMYNWTEQNWTVYSKLQGQKSKPENEWKSFVGYIIHLWKMNFGNKSS